jgi:hypothetical protein
MHHAEVLGVLIFFTMCLIDILCVCVIVSLSLYVYVLYAEQ